MSSKKIKVHIQQGIEIEYDPYNGGYLAINGIHDSTAFMSESSRAVYQLDKDMILKIECHFYGYETLDGSYDQCRREAHVLQRIMPEHTKHFPKFYGFGERQGSIGEDFKYNLRWILTSRTYAAPREITDADKQIMTALSLKYRIGDLNEDNWSIDRDTDQVMIFDCGMELI